MAVPTFEQMTGGKPPSFEQMTAGAGTPPTATADDLKGRYLDRSATIVKLRDQTGVDVGKINGIYDEVDAELTPWERSMASGGLAPYIAQKEREMMVADIVGAIKETPENLYIGGIGFTASALEAVEWNAKLFNQSPFNEPGFEATDEIYVTEAPVITAVRGVADWLRGKEKAKQDAQMRVTLRNAPITRIARLTMQGGVPSAGVAIGLTLLTGNPSAGLIAFFETTAGAEYKEQIKAGGTEGKANLIAVLTGAAEVGGEMLVLPKFVRGLTKGIPLRNAVALVGENYGQEFATGYVQGFLDTFGKETSKGTPIEDAARKALDDAWDQAKESGLVGAATAGLIDAASLPASIYTRASQTQEVQGGEAKPTAAPTAPEVAAAVPGEGEPPLAGRAEEAAQGPAAEEVTPEQAEVVWDRLNTEPFVPANETETDLADAYQAGLIESAGDVRDFLMGDLRMMAEPTEAEAPKTEVAAEAPPAKPEPLFYVQPHEIERRLPGNILVRGPEYIVYERATQKEAGAYPTWKEAYARTEELNAAGKSLEGTARKPAILGKAEEAMVPESKALLAALKKAETAARVAYRHGEKVGTVQGIEAGKEQIAVKLAKVQSQQRQAETIRTELMEWVKENVPAELRAKVYPALARITTLKGPQTNLKELVQAVRKAQAVLTGADKRQAIRELKKTWGDIQQTYRYGEKALGRLDEATRTKLTAVMDKLDLAKLSEGKKEDLASLGRYLNQLADEVGTGLRTMTEAEDALVRIPKGRLDALNRLGKMPVSEMEAEDIREIGNSLRQFVHNYELREQLKGERRGRAMKEVQDQAIAEIRPVIEPTTNLTEPEKEGFLRRVFGTNSSRIDTLVQRMTGTGDTATRQLLDQDLHEGWRKRAELARQGIEYAREYLQRIGFGYADFEKLQTGRTVTLGGKQYEISGEEALAFYLHAQWDSNVRRLLGTEGLRIKNHNAPTITDLTELQGIIDTLTDKERAYGDLFTNLNRDVFREPLNAVGREMEGYEKATEEHYFPIHRAMPKRVAGTVADVAIEDYGPFQPRTGGSAPINIVPFTSELMNTMQVNSLYVGMAIPMYNARTLLNSRAWQDAAREAGHGEAANAIIKLMQRVQGFPTTQSYLEMVGQKVLNKISKSILSARIGTVLTQMSVLPMAYAEIDAKHFVGVTPSLARLDRLKKYSAVLWERWESGQVSIEMGNIAAQHAAENLLFGKMGWTEKPLRAMTRMDAEAIELIAGAVENEIQAVQPNLTDEAFDQAVALRTEYVVRRTQQMWDMLDRSVLSSDPSIAWRTVLIFRSAQEAMLNVLLRANHKYAFSDRTIADKAAWTRQTGAVLSSITMQVAMAAALGWALQRGADATLVALGIIDPGEPPGDEDHESVALKLGADILAGIVSLVPLGNAVGPVIRWIPTRIQGKPKWKLEPYDNPFAAVVTASYDVIRDGVDLADGLLTGDTYESGPNKGEPKWERPAWDLTDKTLDVVAKLTGAPYSAPRKEIIGPVRRALKEHRPYRNMSDMAVVKAVEYEINKQTPDYDRLNELVAEYNLRRK